MSEINAWLVPLFVTIAFVCELLFVVCHLLFTRWWREALGPYVVRFNVVVLTVLVLAMMSRFWPGYSRFDQWTRPFAWGLIAAVMLDQLRVLSGPVLRAARKRRTTGRSRQVVR